ncbi:hypothetical protein HMN09_00820900 [Mycena chlorophos]|uniref:Uncharacterized protein n=1 Tax=Mycena chlorophos TaxID=658473 RepID=A0A8H6W5J3_MYCCL|nr:hypothetical protein HMN09_00820900 [Mycena chlorophos]
MPSMQNRVGLTCAPCGPGSWLQMCCPAPNEPGRFPFLGRRDSDSSLNGLTPGFVAAMVIVTVLGLALITFGIVFLVRRSYRKKHHNHKNVKNDRDPRDSVSMSSMTSPEACNGQCAAATRVERRILDLEEQVRVLQTQLERMTANGTREGNPMFVNVVEKAEEEEGWDGATRNGSTVDGASLKLK